MSVEWKYKIDIIDETCFDKYEKKYNILFTEDFKEFIIENNGASPDKDCVVIGESERVVEYLLSFNEKEDEATTFEDVYENMENKEYIPFAIDSFGNYFFYSIEDEKVGFYEHEEDTYTLSEMSLCDFVEALY